MLERVAREYEPVFTPTASHNPQEETVSSSPDQRHNPDLPALRPADRIRTAWHILRTGDYQPAAAYLKGVSHGLDTGIRIARHELHPRPRD